MTGSEEIVSAALLVEGEVWTLPRPARHCHLVNAWSAAHWKDGKMGRIGPHEQGFVTSTGRFVGREEAAVIAGLDKPRLYSEDLW